MKKNPTIIPVVAVALVDSAGRVLMQQRRVESEHGGLWEFPGGKVEPQETLENALCREIYEELGLDVVPQALDALTFVTAPDQPYVILLYTCREWRGDPQGLDGQSIAWFTPDAITALAMPPLDVPLARTLRDWLKTSN